MRMTDTITVLADGPIPGYTPSLPAPLVSLSSTVLGWTAGIGLGLCVLGLLMSLGCIGVGEWTERDGLAVRGKKGVKWSLISAAGFGCGSALLATVYSMAASSAGGS
ncbi:hypothetical protein [Streptomyces sp. SS]|uniref:hypothetical protein n=1 Tax=Streptomyces sp. SS TaxID=260742 RepID=UPI000474D936|nr:hypothetical protein [Streptomyces sp. SS]